MTFIKDGLTINLPCEQASYGYSLGKRIFWFFSGCSCECSLILRIIEDPRRPNLSCQKIKFIGSLNCWFMTMYDSIRFIVVWFNPKEKAESFSIILTRNNRGNVKTFCITFICGFNVISVYVDIVKVERIPCGFVII